MSLPPPPTMPQLTWPPRHPSLADEARALLSSPDRLATLVGHSPEARRGACVVLAGILRGSLSPRSPEREEQPAAEPRFPVGESAVVAGE